MFINSFDSGNTPFLNELQEFAIKTNVPVIRPEMQRLLKLLLSIKKPEQILEVGTAIGFSALLMKEYAPEGCKITTIENMKKESRLPRRISKKWGGKRKSPSLQGMLGSF